MWAKHRNFYELPTNYLFHGLVLSQSKIAHSPWDVKDCSALKDIRMLTARNPPYPSSSGMSSTGLCVST
jgi:hypothetical protein